MVQYTDAGLDRQGVFDGPCPMRQTLGRTVGFVR